MGLSGVVCNDEKEVQRFILGIYNENNDRSTKTNSTLERYKPIIMMNSIELEAYVRDFLKSKLQAATKKPLN